MKSKLILTILIILVLIILAVGVLITLIFVSPKSKFPAGTAVTGTAVIIGSVSGAAGATNIAVPITVSGLGTQKVYAIDITLTYDQNLIIATAVQKGSIASSWNLESNVSTAGQVRIALYSTSELASSGGEIAKIIFSVISGASSGSKSALTLTKANLNEVTANNKLNGEFTIQ